MTLRPGAGQSSASWLWSVDPARVVHSCLDAAAAASQAVLQLHAAGRLVPYPEAARTYRETAEHLAVVERAMRDLAHDVAAANPGSIVGPDPAEG